MDLKPTMLDQWKIINPQLGDGIQNLFIFHRNDPWWFLIQFYEQQIQRGLVQAPTTCKDPQVPMKVMKVLGPKYMVKYLSV